MLSGLPRVRRRGGGRIRLGPGSRLSPGRRGWGGEFRDARRKCPGCRRDGKGFRRSGGGYPLRPWVLGCAGTARVFWCGFARRDLGLRSRAREIGEAGLGGMRIIGSCTVRSPIRSRLMPPPSPPSTSTFVVPAKSRDPPLRTSRRQSLIEIEPMRIVRLDQLDFPGPFPFFDLFLAPDRRSPQPRPDYPSPTILLRRTSPHLPNQRFCLRTPHFRLRENTRSSRE